MFQNLDSLPHNSEPTFWADFIEVQVICNPDKCFSLSDYNSIMNRNKDGITLEENINDDNPLINKKQLEIKWSDTVNFILNRKQVYSDYYPFDISEDRNTISLKKIDQQKVFYIFLLIASSLRLIKPNSRKTLTSNFEVLTVKVLEKLMPTHSIIKATGKGSNAAYKGKSYEKLRAIAKDIRGKVIFNDNDFSPYDTGDTGIDAVAWYPMYDNRCGIPIAFAQSGCSPDDWESKQFEASPVSLYNKINTMHPWITYYFLPLDHRSSSDCWMRGNKWGQVIPVDRLRIINIVKNEKISLEYLSDIQEIAIRVTT